MSNNSPSAYISAQQLQAMTGLSDRHWRRMAASGNGYGYGYG